jgi:lichenan operon transcriptional antiterminator
MIRKCFVAHFSKDNLFLQLEMEKLLHKKVDFESLHVKFTEVLKKFSLQKSTEEVQLFLKYLLVSVIRQNKIKISIELQERSLNVKHLQVTTQVLDDFEKEYSFHFNQEEQLFLTMVLGGCNVIPDEKEKITRTVDHVIEKIIFEFNEQFTQKESLKASLVTHISTAFKRIKLGISIDNPLKELIQSRYFMASYYAYMLAEELNQSLEISIDDHEAAYLALHFEANMEGNGLANKLNVFVVCGGGVGTSTVLKSKLESNFPQIHIQEVMPYYMLKNRDLSTIDFIISTHIIDFEVDKIVIHVNPILGEEDLSKILQMIRYGALYDHMRDLFSENLFFTNRSYQNRDECLHFLTDQLIKEEFITPNVQNDVLEREEKSTTELGHLIAIPHCLTDQKSRMAVLILNEPIKWKNEQVQLIFFGCINPKDQRSKKYFPQIYKKANHPSWVNDVINEKQFDRFISSLTI